MKEPNTSLVALAALRRASLRLFVNAVNLEELVGQVNSMVVYQLGRHDHLDNHSCQKFRKIRHHAVMADTKKSRFSEQRISLKMGALPLI